MSSFLLFKTFPILLISIRCVAITFTILFDPSVRVANPSIYSIVGWVRPPDSPQTPNRIYILGGCNVNQTICYNYTRGWDIGTGSKFTTNNLPMIIYGIGQTYDSSFDGILYFVYNKNIGLYNMTSEILIYPHNNVEISNGIIEQCLIYKNNFIYLIGGQIINTNTSTNDFVIYNIDSGTFEYQTKLLNEGRYYGSCNYYNDNIYSIGGANEYYNGYNIIEIFNNNEWNIINNKMKYNISKHKSFIISENIYIIGGITHNNIALTELFIFNVINNSFIYNIGQLQRSRIGAGIIYNYRYILAYMGMDINNNIQDNWELSSFVSETPTQPLTTTMATTETPSNTPKPNVFDPKSNTLNFVLLILGLLVICIIMLLLMIFCYLRGKQVMQIQMSENTTTIDSLNMDIHSPSKEIMVPTNVGMVKVMSIDGDTDEKEVTQGQIEGNISPGDVTGNTLNGDNTKNNEIDKKNEESGDSMYEDDDDNGINRGNTVGVGDDDNGDIITNGYSPGNDENLNGNTAGTQTGDL